jgi:hypothetical protein
MLSQVAAVRRILDERGLVSGQQFDEEVQSRRNGRVRPRT